MDLVYLYEHPDKLKIFGKEILNLDVEYYICSSTKSNPSKTIEIDEESNHFDCLKLDSNYNGEIKPTRTYNNFKILTLCKK